MNWRFASRIFCCIVLILSAHRTSAQELLANGGFEELNICTEYAVECAPEAWISNANGFANYFKDRNRSHKSVNCMAIEAGHFAVPYRRTLIRSRLLCGLRNGAKYHLEFYIKTAHEVLDSMGVWFTSSDPIFEKKPLHQITPSLYLAPVVNPMKIEDSLWHKIELEYTATGQEAFISFGYFAREDFVGEKVHPLENRFFVFLDDVSLVPLDPHEQLCANWRERKEEIYEENERHQLLEKKIKYYKTNPPPPPTITRNVYLHIDTLVLPDILFETGKAELQKGSNKMLDSISSRIRASLVDSIVIEGHTDSVGTYAFNEKLSYDRANTVRNYLASQTGFSSFITRGWSFLKPVGDNKTPAGRQQNRRVEVFLYIRE